MAKLEWNKDLSVGIELIDNQHKTWIDHLNDTSEAVEKRKNQAQIIKTLDFLVDYTEHHFATEEKHMKKNDYPGFKEHKEKHEELKKTLDNLVQDFEEEGLTADLPGYVNTFLGNWLLTHIREIDLKFGKFLQEKGVSITEE